MILLAFLLLAGGVAQPEVSFAGDWKLNTSKSDFGQFPAPAAMSHKNTHEEPSLKVAVKMSTDNGDFDWESAYKTDGTETTNQFGPNEMKSKAAWEGKVLVITTKASFGDTELTMVDKWSLSADGKTLTIQRHWTSSRGEMDQKLVLEKQ
ncbi:MAG: hypothetical protein HXY18_01615 [Bryobacteraceae bacterium]|nr:hypothetical protein [Bryobacteraceae bacterium]